MKVFKKAFRLFSDAAVQHCETISNYYVIICTKLQLHCHVKVPENDRNNNNNNNCPDSALGATQSPVQWVLGAEAAGALS
jgi:hypothetical protein